VFREQDTPKYRPGIETTMIANALVIIITGLFSIKFHGANKRAGVGGRLLRDRRGLGIRCNFMHMLCLVAS
jgi:hypothetical protein